MTFNEWKNVKLKEIIYFNPTETIKKGTLAKKIGMDKLETFQRKISGFEMEEYKSGTKFRNGDTLFARITPCLENGKTAQVTILNENEIAFGSTEYIVLREIQGKSINDFIYYLSISPEFRDIAIKSMTGTTGRQRAQKDVLENSSFAIPPIEEQKAIANILSSLDEKVETNYEINKALEEIAAAIFKHWFVDFEFPNENGEPYHSSGGDMVESELGLIPKGWKNGTLTEIGDLIMGQSPKGDTYNFEGNGLGLVNGASDFKNGEINPLKYTTDPKKVSKEGDWIFGVRATVGNVTYVDKEYCLGRGVGVVRSQEDIYREYLYFILVASIDYLEKTALGSVYINLTKTDFENIKVKIPDRRTIESFHIKSGPIFKKINSLREENRKLTEIRDTLLPKLMSGEIRIPIGE